MNNKFPVEDVIFSHYKQLEEIVNSLAEKCLGGEEGKIVFPAGTVTIKIK